MCDLHICHFLSKMQIGAISDPKPCADDEPSTDLYDSIPLSISLTFYVKITGLKDPKGRKAKFLVNPIIMYDISDLFRRKYPRGGCPRSIAFDQYNNSKDISISYDAYKAFFELAMGQPISLDLELYFQLLRLSKYFESPFLTKRLLKIGFRNHIILLKIEKPYSRICEKDILILIREIGSVEHTSIDMISIFFGDILNSGNQSLLMLKMYHLAPKDIYKIVKSDYCNFPTTEVFDDFIINYIKYSLKMKLHLYSMSCKLLQFINFEATSINNMKEIYLLLHGESVKMYEYCVFPQFDNYYKLRIGE